MLRSSQICQIWQSDPLERPAEGGSVPEGRQGSAPPIDQRNLRDLSNLLQEVSRNRFAFTRRLAE